MPTPYPGQTCLRHRLPSHAPLLTGDVPLQSTHRTSPGRLPLGWQKAPLMRRVTNPPRHFPPSLPPGSLAVSRARGMLASAAHHGQVPGMGEAPHPAASRSRRLPRCTRCCDTGRRCLWRCSSEMFFTPSFGLHSRRPYKSWLGSVFSVYVSEPPKQSFTNTSVYLMSEFGGGSTTSLAPEAGG